MISSFSTSSTSFLLPQPCKSPPLCFSLEGKQAPTKIIVLNIIKFLKNKTKQTKRIKKLQKTYETNITDLHTHTHTNPIRTQTQNHII